jgi:hypothetical protein
MKEPGIREIRFTRQAQELCRPWGRDLADDLVCEAVVNGKRRPTGGRGPRGGSVCRYEKAHGRDLVVVVAELVGRTCFALTAFRTDGDKRIGRAERADPVVVATEEGVYFRLGPRRLRNLRGVRTEPFPCPWPHLALDFDASGSVIGVEAVFGPAKILGGFSSK